MTLADVEKIGLDLDSAANIVENFENPEIPEEKRLELQGDGAQQTKENDPWNAVWARLAAQGSVRSREQRRNARPCVSASANCRKGEHKAESGRHHGLHMKRQLKNA